MPVLSVLRTELSMAEGDGHYESLALEQVEDATYDTLQTKTKKERDLLRLLRSDIRRHKRVGVGAGVFCVVLALLNVAVPLHLHQSNMVERQRLQSILGKLQNKHLNLTEKKGQLETSLDQLKTSYGQLETRCDRLESVRYQIPIREREQFETRISNLTDEWKTEINHMTKEKDELKMRLCESPGWQKFDGGCYYFSTEEKTWEESRQWCRDHQSDLVVIKSKEKQDFVASLSSNKGWVWLGLTDSAVEGSFHWVDGTPLTTPTFWYPGQPDGEGSWNPNAFLTTPVNWMPGHPDGESRRNPNLEADCVWYYNGFYKRSDEARLTGWGDEQCSTTTYWMCERSLC